MTMTNEPRSIPRPSAVTGTWFPATIKLPDEQFPWATCKIVATLGGLYVWRQRPEDAAESPQWFSPIDYSKTPKPLPEYAQRSAGVIIQTSAGTASIAPESGCGCSHPLKHWTPNWAFNTTPWPTQEG